MCRVRKLAKSKLVSLPKLLRNEIVSNMSRQKQKKSKNLGDIFDEHVKYEFIDHDVEATMKTMVNEPIFHRNLRK